MERDVGNSEKEEVLQVKGIKRCEEKFSYHAKQ
jgi:hypothetical protein